MGRATALRLAADGWTVAAADRDEERLAALAEELAAASDGGSPAALALPLDLAGPPSEVDAAVALVVERLGPPWLLAVAAGVLEGGLALDAPDAHWQRVLGVNFHGVVRANVAAARAMVAAGAGGRIVNWSSNNAAGGTAGYAAYAASKAAMEAFSRSLAMELGPEGITVNTIRPGSVRTPMLGALTQAEIDAENARIPLGRFGEPEDAAGLVAFLASDDAAWISGADIPLDGGTLAARGRANVQAVRAARARGGGARVSGAGIDGGGAAGAGGRLAGRVALVTGASRGIGAALCRGLAAEGAAVAIHHRPGAQEAADAEALARELRDDGARAAVVSGDVADKAQVEAFVAAARERLGPLDLLVANAAATARVPWTEIDGDEWRRVLGANLDGLLWCAQAVHDGMRERGGGAIVTVSSVTVELGAAGALHYVTSKAGIVGFTRALAREVGGEGIRVNCVMPGAIRTEAELEQFPDQDALAAEQAAAEHPRRGLPEDLVGAVVFLCSDESGFVTGQVLTVDGGWTMR